MVFLDRCRPCAGARVVGPPEGGHGERQAATDERRQGPGEVAARYGRQPASRGHLQRRGKATFRKA